MYLEYFSLERHPFRITPDTSLFFSGGSEGRGVVLDAMLYAIETGEGILKVVGEVGSGKTMLCRMLEERLPETTEVVYIANPNLSPDEILYAVSFELKLPVRRDTSKLLVMQQLQNYLLKQHSANRKVLVIIEEAQGMPVETLEEIRLFSNLETHRDKLMQIILFGQPELDRNLSAKHIRQLRERITHSFYLSPLTREQTADYIHFRLGAAGCPCPILFTRAAEWLIAKASGGLTRRINILSDKALLAAFAENVLESPEKLGPDVPPVVKARHVYAAIRDSEYSASVIKTVFSPAHVVSASVLFAVVALTIFLWTQPQDIAVTLNLDDTNGRVSEPSQGLFRLALDTDPRQLVATTRAEPISKLIQAPLAGGRN
ncbi:MAG: AAA family ATPase [Proteobacteria bacterium]|nr:AAA family ATPase [Pseudomonadota bacterium]